MMTNYGAQGAPVMYEYEGHTTGQDAEVIELFPRIGRVVAEAPPTPGSDTNGVGEVAARLEGALGDAALFLYNRQLGGGLDGGIDIIAVAPSGVFVIDPDNCPGSKVRANTAGDVLVIDGRLRPRKTAHMDRQYEVVAAAVLSSPVPQAPVGAAYCFVDADLPWSRLEVNCVQVLSPRKTAKMLGQPGTLDEAGRHALHRYLNLQFPPDGRIAV
jgi:hypothetical protein